jgi:hypothetical protein
MAALCTSEKPSLARGVSEFSFSSMPTHQRESVALLEWLDESLNKQVQESDNLGATIDDHECAMVCTGADLYGA